jgi:hypothetical protein
MTLELLTLGTTSMSEFGAFKNLVNDPHWICSLLQDIFHAKQKSQGTLS